MKRALKNIITSIRTYRFTSVMSIIGLTCAYAVILLVMFQVVFDFRFDRFHKDADRIYYLAIANGESTPWGIMSRPDIDNINSEVLPEIEDNFALFKPFNGVKTYFTYEINGEIKGDKILFSRDRKSIV